MNEIYDVSIQEVRTENEKIKTFRIIPKIDVFKSASPGQYLLIRLKENDDWTEFHPFTITAGSDENDISITVKKIGTFTGLLHTIVPPRTAQIKGPLGNFGTGIDSANSLVFIAGGIGITPFITMLRHLKKTESDTKITLLWANETHDDLFYLKELAHHQKTLNLQTVLILNSTEKPADPEQYGFIWEHGYITKGLLEKYAGTGSSYYMCGSPAMQAYLSQQLAETGVSAEAVHIEKVGTFMNGTQIQ